jgi:Mn-dependent DtxR family transcriptional regulator
VQTDERRLVRLSPRGVKVVHAVRAKRAIVKNLLHDVLGLPDDQAEIDSCKVEHLISDDTAQRLLHFLQFLTSGSPASRHALKQFREARSTCPTSRTCAVCKEHCLYDELKYAN